MNYLPRAACSGMHFLEVYELFFKKPGFIQKTDK